MISDKWYAKIIAALDVSSARNNQRLAIFAVCLVIATILWFLNALSKNYTTQIAYPVKYVQLPRNKFIINEPPKNLQLRVNAHGFTLLRYKLHLAFYPVELNISEIMVENRLPSGSLLTIKPGDILEKITIQISNDLNILDVRPSSIHLVFDSLESRMLPVVSRPDIHYMSRFGQAGDISVIPPMVEVTGPRAAMEKTDTIYTEKRTFRNVKTDIVKDISIEIPASFEVQPEKVTVTVPVDEFTEKSFQVPVAIHSLPPGKRIRLFPRQAEVSFSIGLKSFSEITAETVKIYVDWQDAESGLPFLPLRADSITSKLKSLKISPRNVEYLIEQE